MEKNKVVKISLSTFFLILSIIVIIVMGIFMYKLYIEKEIEVEKNSELQGQVNSLNETVNNLQGKIDSISNTINSNGTAKNNTEDDNGIFTDEQIKVTLANVLELQAHANNSTLIEELVKKGKLSYDASKDKDLNDGTILTNIKFLDYKNAMLNYVSENQFESNWVSTQGFKKSSDGYLIRSQGGGGLRVYTINSITKTDDSTYSAKITYIVDDDQNMKESGNIVFTIESYNSNCVIDYMK